MKDSSGRQDNWRAWGVIVIGTICIVVGAGLSFPGLSQVSVDWPAAPTAMQRTDATVVPQTPAQVAAARPTLPPLPSPISLPTLAMLPTVPLSPAPISLPTLAMLPTLSLSPSPTLSPALDTLPTATGLPEPSTTPTAQPQGPSKAAAFSLTIVHTNDTWGYTRPCG